ncbi:MAG: hypothetical protein LBS27_09760 [Bifidobacteriaceae bacterium]|jgi:hypothetical protein|nr:hypothetical protein [Bifidobacteriaceae bacterium]
MTRTKKLLSLLTVAALAGSAGIVGAVSGHPAGAAPVFEDTPLSDSGIPTYYTANVAKSVDTGTVKLANGTAAVGTPVYLLLEAAGSFAVGQTKESKPFAVVHTDSQGRYKVPSAALPASIAGKPTMLYAVAIAGSSGEVAKFEVNSNPAATGLSTSVPGPEASGSGQDIAASASQAIPDLSEPGLIVLPAAAKNGAAPSACVPRSTDKLLSEHPANVVLTFVASDTPYASATVTYTSGSSSQLGWATSATGKNGSWKSSGTRIKSSTATQGFPTKTGKLKYVPRTRFMYGKHRISITCLMQTRHEYRVESYAGGDYSYNASSMPTTKRANCVQEWKGSWFEKTSTTATKWTNGVSASAVIGIDLSIQTGFSSTTKIKYKFAGPAALCGANAPPGGSPGFMFARPASVL